MSLSHVHEQPSHDRSTHAELAPGEIAELVRTNLPLVGHIVREVANRLPSHVNRDDLVSAGMYALASSAKNFRPDRGVPFPRFAAIRIRGALTDELRGMDWVSRGARGRVRELSGVRADLAQQLGREPSAAELAHASALSVGEVKAIEADAERGNVLSLQALTAQNGLDALAARTDGPETLIVRREQIGYVRDAVAELPTRLRIVITAYFFDHRKMAEIADELGVTESRVSQMRAEGLRVLQAGLQSVGVDQSTVATTGRGAAVTSAAPVVARRPRAASDAYCAAVASRSTLAGRLSASTLLAESYSEHHRTAGAGSGAPLRAG